MFNQLLYLWFLSKKFVKQNRRHKLLLWSSSTVKLDSSLGDTFKTNFKLFLLTVFKICWTIPLLFCYGLTLLVVLPLLLSSSWIYMPPMHDINILSSSLLFCRYFQFLICMCPICSYYFCSAYRSNVDLWPRHLGTLSPQIALTELVSSLIVFHISFSLLRLLITVTLTASTQEAFELHRLLYDHNDAAHQNTISQKKMKCFHICLAFVLSVYRNGLQAVCTVGGLVTGMKTKAIICRVYKNKSYYDGYQALH